MVTIRLKPKADYRLCHGHLWIYSNEIDNKASPLRNFQAGDTAIIENALGKVLGLAYINPNSLICGRLLNNSGANIDQDFFIQGITKALHLRERIFKTPCYRLIYGESDFLPGLVVDRYFDILVVQISTAGMERYLDLIVNALDSLIKPQAILLKNDGKMRSVEGLETYTTWAKGAPCETALLQENGVKFAAPILHGQKTGWFYDHRMMRGRLRDYVAGKRVLDMFSYIGGWGIQAAAFGASEVICSDVSQFALDCVQQNAELNQLTNVQTILGDAFEVMQNLSDKGETFDVVILDPPAFIPKQKDHAKGYAAYQKANLQAMRLLKPNGVLVSGSCSMHLAAADLKAAIQRAGLKLARRIQILEVAGQGPDHPIHPAIPETDYLKSFLVHVQ